MTSLRPAPWPVFEDSKTPGRARVPTLRHTRRAIRLSLSAKIGREDRNPKFVHERAPDLDSDIPDKLQVILERQADAVDYPPVSPPSSGCPPDRHYHSHSRVDSGARRTALGWTKRSTGKSLKEKKENIGQGTLPTSILYTFS
jgi:hypothetical protein